MRPVWRKSGGLCEYGGMVWSCGGNLEYGWILMFGDRAIERCTFDQARLIRHNRILAKNGIAPDGK